LDQTIITQNNIFDSFGQHLKCAMICTGRVDAEFKQVMQTIYGKQKITVQLHRKAGHWILASNALNESKR